MTLIFKLTLFLTLSAHSLPALAKDACGLSDDETYFTKPNGERLYLLFGNHAHPDETGTAFMLKIVRDAKGDPDQIQNSVRHILTDRTDNNIDDQRHTLKKLSREHAIEWVGWEGLPQSFDSVKLEQLKTSVAVVSNLYRKNGVPQDHIDRLIAYALGPFLNNLMAGEDWATRLKSVPFDSDHLKENEALISDKINTIKFDDRPVLEVYRINKLLTATINSTNAVDADSLAQVVLTYPLPVRARLTEGLKFAMQYRDSIHQRNLLSVTRLLQEHGNGALVMGSVHRTDVLNLLKAQCNVEKKQVLDLNAPNTTE